MSGARLARREELLGNGVVRIHVGTRSFLVDEIDLPLVRGSHWSIDTGRVPRVRRHFAQKPAKLHRAILNAPDGLEVDHINGDPLDNRRCNLRLATRKENAHNLPRFRKGSSRFKGVHWHKKNGKWCAMIRAKKRFIGLFDKEEDAARAYDAVARVEFGDFARLNFPTVQR